jgi:hypothetical protein
MNAIVLRHNVAALLILLAGLAAWSQPAQSQEYRDDEFAPHWWLGAGVGGASVRSLVPAPSADRGAFAASVDFGFRFTPQVGLGLEFGATAPTDGCSASECAVNAAEFAPTFTRMFAFGEFRPRESGWRLRAGAGLSRFCIHSHWSDNAWGWADTFDLALLLLNDDRIYDLGGSGGYRCDGRKKALGGMLSVGYDWRVSANAPLSMGLRLSGEAANFDADPSIGLPAFRHRAVMMTLHLNIN